MIEAPLSTKWFIPALVLACASMVHGQTPPDIPPDALAWWRFNPSRFASVQTNQQGRELFIAALRSAAVLGGGSGRGSGGVIEGLLAASEVGASPHTLALLEMRARRHSSGHGAEFDALQMVLHIEADSGHDRLLRTIKTILVDAPDARNNKDDGPPRQQSVDLPGGRHGVEFTRRGWDSTRTISWCSADDAFVVGLGDGALQRWFENNDQGSGLWAAHSAVVDDARPDGDVCLEAFMDIDAMRDRFPAAFLSGRTPRLRSALGLDRAHEFMVHARFVENPISQDAPPLIALDLTASTSVGIEHRLLSEHTWPIVPTSTDPPPGSYVVAINADWREVFALALAIYESTIQDPDLPGFRAARASWEATYADALNALFDSLSGSIVLSDIPPPVVPVPGLCTVFIESREGISQDMLDMRLSETLASFNEVIVRGENRERWLRLDERGLIRLPAWGIAARDNHSAIVGSWGAAAVRAAARWFEQSSTPDTGTPSGPSPKP